MDSFISRAGAGCLLGLLGSSPLATTATCVSRLSLPLAFPLAFSLAFTLALALAAFPLAVRFVA
jgi:hypothetical protein